MVGIDLFTKKDCPKCKRVKAVLKSKNISFREYDAETAEGMAELAAREKLAAFMPVMYLDGVEVDPEIVDYDKLVASAGEKPETMTQTETLTTMYNMMVTLCDEVRKMNKKLDKLTVGTFIECDKK